MKKALTAVMLLSLFLLGGCMTTSGISKMSDAEYLDSTKEVQQTYLTGLGTKSDALKLKKDAEYYAGVPVMEGDDGTKYTKQWVKLPGEFDAVAVYPGHNPEGLSGAVHEGMYLALGDKKGNFVYQTLADGSKRPIPLLANVQASEDFWAAMAKGAISGLSNGLLSSVVNNAMRCDDCGGSGVVNIVEGAQAISGSMAGAEANTTSNAGVNTGGSWMK